MDQNHHHFNQNQKNVVIVYKNCKSVIVVPLLFVVVVLQCAELVSGFAPPRWTPQQHQPKQHRRHPHHINNVRRQGHPLHFVDPEQSFTLLNDFGSLYNYCVDNYYLPTQSTIGGVFAAMGDVIAQYQTISKSSSSSSSSDEEKDPNKEILHYDPKRTWHYFLKGLGGGIVWACWFQVSEQWSVDLTRQLLFDDLHLKEVALSQYLTQENTPIFLASLKTIEQGTRTIINILGEQFLVCPLLYAFWDIPIPALLSGSPLRQIPNQVQCKLIPLLIANAQVWTPVNIITYNIPVDSRVLFSSCADILWQSINAGITSQEIEIPMAPPPLPGTTTTVVVGALAGTTNNPAETLQAEAQAMVGVSSSSSFDASYDSPTSPTVLSGGSVMRSNSTDTIISLAISETTF